MEPRALLRRPGTSGIDARRRSLPGSSSSGTGCRRGSTSRSIAHASSPTPCASQSSCRRGRSSRRGGSDVTRVRRPTCAGLRPAVPHRSVRPRGGDGAARVLTRACDVPDAGRAGQRPGRRSKSRSRCSSSTRDSPPPGSRASTKPRARGGWTSSRCPPCRIGLSPNVVVVGLLAGSALLLGAAGVLVYLAWPRRAPAPPPEPEPEPELSRRSLRSSRHSCCSRRPCEHDGAGDQRRALELVAEQLDEWGDADLAGCRTHPRVVGGVPRVEQTTSLAARVRAELDAGAGRGRGVGDERSGPCGLDRLARSSAPPAEASTATMPARSPRPARRTLAPARSCSPVLRPHCS